MNKMISVGDSSQTISSDHSSGSFELFLSDSSRQLSRQERRERRQNTVRILAQVEQELKLMFPKKICVFNCKAQSVQTNSSRHNFASDSFSRTLIAT